MVVLSGDKKRNLGILSGLLAKAACVITMATLLVSCGGNSENKGYSYTVSGTVSGMVGGGLVLQNNDIEELVVTANGSFSFTKALHSGSTYSITVKTQPPALSQTCIVRNGNGTVNTSPVGSVSVNCVAPPPRLVVDPSGKFAYAANYKSNNISAYTIDNGPAGIGALTAVAGSPFAAGTNPNSLTIDPSGKFAYAANINSGNISAYAINAGTGGLIEIASSPFPAGTNPYAVTVDPLGKFAYVANVKSDNVSAYTINAGTGALTPVAGSPFSAGTSPYAVTIDPSGKFAYVTNTGSRTISTYTIDQTTGALTAGNTVDTASNPGFILVDPSGKFAYTPNMGSSNISIYAIDQTTGVLTVGTTVSTGTDTSGTGPSSMIIDPSGKFAYASNMRSNKVSVYTIDQTTGALTAGTKVAAGTKPYTVTIIPSTAILSGQFAYAANYISNDISVYAVKQTTGALTAQTAVNAGTNPYAFTIDPSGRFAYALNAGTNNISVYAIDQTTGALTAQTPVPLP